MRMKYRLFSVLAFGFAIAAYCQQSAPLPAKPADSGPTLAATMQFIQEKLSEVGKVGMEQTQSNYPGFRIRGFFHVSDVMADPAACTLHTTTTKEVTIDRPSGATLAPGETAEDSHTSSVITDTISFKQVEKVTVEKVPDLANQGNVEAGHPEIIVTVTPPVFVVQMWASSAVFSSHTSSRTGKQAPVEKDATNKTDGFDFRDEESANHVARAMIHAMELCGGGVTKKELF